MATITFDIEVAGFPWEEVDEITRGYLLSRARTPEDREAVPERNALVPGLGKVIAIAMWLVEQDRGYLLLEGSSQPEHEWEKVPGSEIQRGDEAEILRSIHLAFSPESNVDELAAQAQPFFDAGVDLVIYSMRGPYSASEVERLAGALAAL